MNTLCGKNVIIDQIYITNPFFHFLASAANENLLPYFQTILEHLKVYLTEPHNDENSELQTQALGE